MRIRRDAQSAAAAYRLGSRAGRRDSMGGNAPSIFGRKHHRFNRECSGSLDTGGRVDLCLEHGHGGDDPSAPSGLNFQRGKCLIFIGTEGPTAKSPADPDLNGAPIYSQAFDPSLALRRAGEPMRIKLFVQS